MKARHIAIGSGSVFAIGLDDQVRFIERGAEGLWGPWQNAGATAMGLAHGGDVVGLIGLDGGVSALQRGVSPAWSGWELHASEVSATSLPEVGPALFARGSDGKVWHTWKHAPQWSRWECLDGPVEHIDATVIGGGGFVVFGIRDGTVTHRWQDRPLTPWKDWTDLAAPPGGATGLRVTSTKRGGLALFATAPDGRVYHRWQDKPFGTWHQWEPLGQGDGPALRDLSVTRTHAGGLAVFAIGADGVVHSTHQRKPFGPWMPWVRLEGSATQVAGHASYADGLEAFIIAQDGEVRHKWCDRLDWEWTAWVPLDHEISPLQV